MAPFRLLVGAAILVCLSADDPNASCPALAREGYCQSDSDSMDEQCPGACEEHSRNVCMDLISGLDIENSDDEAIFFPEPEVKPTLKFLIVKPDSNSSILQRHGISVVHRKDGSAMVDMTVPRTEQLESPRCHHLPSWRGWRNKCRKNKPSLQLQPTSLALMQVRGAYATFEGYSMTEQGEVFSAMEETTVTLLDELVSVLPQFYRLSRRCPRGDEIRIPCCLSAKFHSITKLSLNPFLYVNGTDPLDHTEVNVEPDTTIFYDELKVFGSLLQQCHVTRHSLREPTVAYIASKGMIFTFQHLYANNYFHFLAETMPRLLRSLDLGAEILSHPDMWFIASSSVQQSFAQEMMNAIGLNGRIIPYHPCTIYRAEILYFAVTGEGQLLPSVTEISALRRMMSRVPLQPSQSIPTELSGELPSRYVVLLDRSDALPRLKEDGTTTAIPRQLINSDQVRDALQAKLSHAGVAVVVLKTAVLPLAEQVRWISKASVLIGVHGAGLTNAILLSPDAALLELIPGAYHIPNDIDTDEPLLSQCGFTMFWYLAAVSGIQYHSFVLHDVSWEDAFSMPLAPLVRMVADILGIDDSRASISFEGQRSALEHDEL
ncbi:hypothetical protein AB1Y20_013201 [Prymnesium parvum]|uniref:Glycosyltransferase 61 catalytic domain-containing protein n=1 Tax=Prymnesium parvum TaxID=97485 RepID=A0AB34INL0_PRYPA